MANRALPIAMLALAFAAAAYPAQLQLGAPRMGPQGWEAPVLLNPAAGEAVASMQFDLAIPRGMGASAAALASQSATLAGKQANFSQIAPGHLRVVIAGLNQSPLPAGEVAVVQFPADTPDAPAPRMALHAPVLSSPAGERIPVYEASPEPEREPASGGDKKPDPLTPPKENPASTPDEREDYDPPGDDGGEAARNNRRYVNGFNPYAAGGGGFDDRAATKKKGGKKRGDATRSRSAQRSAAGTSVAKSHTEQSSRTSKRTRLRGQEHRDAAANAARQPAYPDARQILAKANRSGSTSSVDVPATATPGEIPLAQRTPAGALGPPAPISGPANLPTPTALSIREANGTDMDIYTAERFGPSPAGRVLQAALALALTAPAVWIYRTGYRGNRRASRPTAEE